MTSLDGKGIPGVGIASSVFVEAADIQGKSLGFHPQMVYVEHPIQDRSDDELRALADKAIDDILSRLTQ